MGPKKVSEPENTCVHAKGELRSQDSIKVTYQLTLKLGDYLDYPCMSTVNTRVGRERQGPQAERSELLAWKREETGDHPRKASRPVTGRREEEMDTLTSAWGGPWQSSNLQNCTIINVSSFFKPSQVWSFITATIEN